MTNLQLLPLTNETPTTYADRLAVLYASNATPEHKKKLGQFFTPYLVSKFLASFAKSQSTKVNILDPGCGIGILSAALCEELANSHTNIREISLVAFETDVDILPYSEYCFSHLGSWLKEKGIDFTYFLCKNDFVLHNSHILKSSIFPNEEYDFIICNPPYFKLAKGDLRITATKSITHGQSNIYSIFMIIAAKLLKKNGFLIFITPRSFCSGSYFRLFREIFFNLVDLKNIHLFHSRNNAFKRDNVLQENIIIVAKKAENAAPEQIQLTFDEINMNKVEISSSEGIDDIGHRSFKSYPVEDILNMKSFQKFLYLPVNTIDEDILNHFRQWSGSLNQYDLEISTGPVVDFRSQNFISDNCQNETVPLLWLHNVMPMAVKWPLISQKGKPKGQYIISCPSSSSRLVDNRNYVLIRRFSTKDDKNRLIAAPYIRPSHNEVKKLGIENHLNYIYHKKREITEDEAFGIALLFNSRLFDLYFRMFNGNINVSATELRDFPLPDFDLIKELGAKAIDKLRKNLQIEPDLLIKSVFKLKMAL